MDRVRLAVAAALLLAGLAAPSTSAVADDAFLAIDSFGLGTAPEGRGYRSEAVVTLTPTSDASDGRYTGNVTLKATDVDDPGHVEESRMPYSVEIEGGGRPPLDQLQVRSGWSLARGLYNVTATVHADGASGAWDSQWVWHAVGRALELGDGWGFEVFPEASSFDVDADGEDDVWLTDDATGEPLARSLGAHETLRIGSLVPAWSSQCGRGLSLELGEDADAPPTRIRIATGLVEALVAGPGPLQMHTQSMGGAPPEPVDGAYEATLGAQFYGTRSDSVFLYRSCVQPERQPHVWGDGFRTTANVTHWDLDQDGAMDVRFWHTDASSVEEARGETTDERRATELLLIAQAHVEQRATRRVLTFELARPGGGHEGAWVEIQDAAGLFRQLLGAPDNASVSYRLSLPANESFVEQDGSTTWAWIGHFSTQTLTVLLEDAAPEEPEGPEDGDATEDASESPSSTGKPAPGPSRGLAGLGPCALLAGVFAAFGLRRRAR